MISSLVFVALLTAGIAGFTLQVRRLRRGLALARPSNRHDRRKERWAIMTKVAMGQSQMEPRRLAALMHFIVYVGFVVINIEVIEILLDGILGTHRLFRAPLGALYDGLMSFFEVLGALVIIAIGVFLVRRLRLGPKRLNHPDLTGWPQKDALNILVIEVVLMLALLLMNASEFAAVNQGINFANQQTPWLISGLFQPLFEGWRVSNLEVFTQSMWWLHFGQTLRLRSSSGR